MSSASAFETQSSRKTGREQVMYKTKYAIFLLSVWYSQSSSMVNVFGANGSGNLQMGKKVVVTKASLKTIWMKYSKAMSLQTTQESIWYICYPHSCL